MNIKLILLGLTAFALGTLVLTSGQQPDLKMPNEYTGSAMWISYYIVGNYIVGTIFLLAGLAGLFEGKVPHETEVR